AALVPPVVHVYPAASLEPLGGRSVLLCVASGMSPPLVSFSWRRRAEGSSEEEEEESLPADEEELRLTEEHRITSVRLVDRDPALSYQYRCSVQHENGTVDALSGQEVEAAPPTVPPTVPPSVPPMKLLCFVYTVLAMKSVLSCCGIPLLCFLAN
uniref:Ig-like domain-containing protein n=1 Tax=Tetraodon nigroviridis TaxID=99883 RepID=H3BW17_TETNG